MELRLYKEPYKEPYTANRLRLLFEGVADPNSIGENRRDLYLYVWIDDRLTLSGFQAVLDEDFVIDFRAPAKIEFSKIGGKPVKRSLSRPLTGRERKSFLALLSGLSNPVFPVLIKTVEAIAHGEAAGQGNLTKEETQTLNNLVASSGAPK
jgi:hypothetical protein